MLNKTITDVLLDVNASDDAYTMALQQLVDVAFVEELSDDDVKHIENAVKAQSGNDKRIADTWIILAAPMNESNTVGFENLKKIHARTAMIFVKALLKTNS